MKAHSRSARLAARTVEPAPADPVAAVARLANAAAHEINNPLTPCDRTRPPPATTVRE
jgi:hypothetical protein